MVVYNLRQNLAASVADFACVTPPLTLQPTPTIKILECGRRWTGTRRKNRQRARISAFQEALAFTPFGCLGRHPQLLRQLGEVDHHPPRFIFGEQVRRRASPRLILESRNRRAVTVQSRHGLVWWMRDSAASFADRISVGKPCSVLRITFRFIARR
jgi:hypothetical protein